MRNTLNRRLTALSPSVTILLGRGTSQAGLFLFLVGPALTLSDEAYNQLTIGVTVMFLAVVAPVGAFQQHLLRLEATSRATWEAMQKSLALAVLCAAFGVIILSLFGAPRWWWLALCVGAVACAVPTLVASLHALASGFGRSAVLDGASGSCSPRWPSLLLRRSAEPQAGRPDSPRCGSSAPAWRCAGHCSTDTTVSVPRSGLF